jgi:hypothetical protein
MDNVNLNTSTHDPNGVNTVGPGNPELQARGVDRGPGDCLRHISKHI